MSRPAETNPIKQAYQKGTRKYAIHAFCSSCMGCTASEQGNGLTDHLEPGFRALIRECASTHCPLYCWRPYQAKVE
jgi:hypothetical protein